MSEPSKEGKDMVDRLSEKLHTIYKGHVDKTTQITKQVEKLQLEGGDARKAKLLLLKDLEESNLEIQKLQVENVGLRHQLRKSRTEGEAFLKSIENAFLHNSDKVTKEPWTSSDTAEDHLNGPKESLSVDEDSFSGKNRSLSSEDLDDYRILTAMEGLLVDDDELHEKLSCVISEALDDIPVPDTHLAEDQLDIALKSILESPTPMALNYNNVMAATLSTFNLHSLLNSSENVPP